MKILMMLGAMMLAGNAAAECPVKAGDTFAFLGDSITQSGQLRRVGYVNLVVDAFAEAGTPVEAIRAGVGGNTSPSMSDRLDGILAKKPRFLTLLCGINDVWHQDVGGGVKLEDFRKFITSILDRCEKAGCEAIVLTCTPFEEKEGEASAHNVKLAPYNAYLRETAKARGLRLADLNAVLWAMKRSDPAAKITKDGVHMRMGGGGDIAMARTILQALDFDAAKLAELEKRWNTLTDLNLGEKKFNEPGVQPHPAKLVASKTTAVPVDEKTRVEASGFVEEVRAEFALWFGMTPEVGLRSAPARRDASGTVRKAEGYSISAKDGRIRIVAADAAGARYAVRTLFQLSVPRRGVRTTDGFLVPECEVEDAPALGWRGTHFCWFPENSEFELTRALYLSALFKFNYVIIENWGAFRSERHPWYGWPKGQMTPDAVRRLAATARKLGVTLVPQLNIYGHASLCRRDSGKHAALDLRPEYAPLFEPDSGWNWCLTNPETYAVQAELADELWELFGRPDCFHIGCDEAEPFKCPDCRAKGDAALFEKVVRFHADRFAARKVKVLMWHDMLLAKGDARWKGFYANGWASTQELAAKLPKNVVVCDWYYDGKKDAYPTLDHFKSLGLEVITCGWKNTPGQLAQGAYAREHGLFGYLGTTWAGNRRDIGVAAVAAWGTQISPASLQDNWRRCGQLAGMKDYLETGFEKNQL